MGVRTTGALFKSTKEADRPPSYKPQMIELFTTLSVALEGPFRRRPRTGLLYVFQILL